MNLKVLIADDHQLMREGTEMLLRQIPAITKTGRAANGFEVLQILEKETFDIILMDIRMPGMDGIKTTHQVKIRFPATRVIAVTMVENHEDIVSMFKAGAEGYVLKTDGISEVETAIQKVMDGKKYYQPRVSELLLEKITDKVVPQINTDVKNRLTKREIEIIQLICKKLSSREIADSLFISLKTVECHRTNIFTKLKCINIADLIEYAVNNKLVEMVSV